MNVCMFTVFGQPNKGIIELQGIDFTCLCLQTILKNLSLFDSMIPNKILEGFITFECYHRFSFKYSVKFGNYLQDIPVLFLNYRYDGGTLCSTLIILELCFCCSFLQNLSTSFLHFYLSVSINLATYIYYIFILYMYIYIHINIYIYIYIYTYIYI